MKTCIHCNEIKGEEEFARRGVVYRNVCKACWNASKRSWVAANPQKRKEYLHKNYAKKTGKNPDECHKIRKTPEQIAAERPAKARAYYLRNRELVIAKSKEYQIKNAAKRSEYHKEWRAKNIEKKAAGDKSWRTRNAPKVNAYGMARYTRKMNARPDWLSAIQLAQIQEAYDVALACSVQTGVPHEVDHVFPLKGRGFSGLHVPWNLRVITFTENRSKRNTFPVEYIDQSWGVI